MTNVYSFDGILVFGILFVCTCAYLKKVPRLNTWLLSEKKGVWGVFYKAAVIGTRLHIAVAALCLCMAFYLIFLKWPGWISFMDTGLLNAKRNVVLANIASNWWRWCSTCFRCWLKHQHNFDLRPALHFVNVKVKIEFWGLWSLINVILVISNGEKKYIQSYGAWGCRLHLCTNYIFFLVFFPLQTQKLYLDL